MAKPKEEVSRRKAERRLREARRHLVLCADTGEEGCASAKRMRRAWKHLGERLDETGAGKKGRVLRSKTGCLGICAAGPILAVYPDGVVYGGCDPDAIDRIVDEHLLGGRVVEDLVLHRMRAED